MIVKKNILITPFHLHNASPQFSISVRFNGRFSFFQWWKMMTPISSIADGKISCSGIPSSCNVLFLQIFLKRAAKPSAGNTSAGFPSVKWPQILLNLTSTLYTKASQTFSGTFSGTLLNLAWLCAKVSSNLLRNLFRNPVEPDLAVHQSLPDLLQNLLRNPVELDLALHRSLNQIRRNLQNLLRNLVERDPAPAPVHAGAIVGWRSHELTLLGKKGLTISNLQRPIQSPCEEPYFPQRTRRSIDPWRTRTHMAHTSQPKMMTRLTTCSHWFDHILSLFSCRCHMPWLCYHVHAFAPMPCFLFLFLSVISWFAFPPRAKRRNYSAWRTGAQKVSLPPKLLHSLLAHAPLCNTHRQNYLPQFLVAPWRPNKMDRIDLRRPVSKVTYQLWVAQLVLREWFCLNWTPFSAVYVWTCFGPLSCLVESESWSFNLWDGHGLFKHLSDNGQVAHFDPTFARQ